MSEILLNGQISSQKNILIVTIFLTGLYVLGVLLGKAISMKKKGNKTEVYFTENNYTSKEQQKDTSIQNDFIPDIEKISTRSEFNSSYNNYEENSEETKDNIDIILENEKINTPTNFSHFKDIDDNTLTNVANNLKKVQNDNLKIIEGIGPKIELLLNNGGIFTYKDLANKDISTIKKILEKGGTRYTLHNPKTWPKQSLLASNGEMDKLKSYQNKLVKGIEKEEI